MSCSGLTAASGEASRTRSGRAWGAGGCDWGGRSWTRRMDCVLLCQMSSVCSSERTRAESAERVTETWKQAVSAFSRTW